MLESFLTVLICTRSRYIENKNNIPDFLRLKIRLDTFYNENKVEIKKIKTAIFIPIDKTKPISERIFKSTPEKITCLDDVRELFEFGCTVQLTLQVSKLWSIKTQLSHDKRPRVCGNVVKCLQIFVLDNPKWNLVPNFTNNIIPIVVKNNVQVSMVPTINNNTNSVILG
jgi:hypothetical protein